jgi:hypothetical protein
VAAACGLGGSREGPAAALRLGQFVSLLGLDFFWLGLRLFSSKSNFAQFSFFELDLDM